MTYLSDSSLLTFLMKWWDYVVLRECESFWSVQRDSLNRTQRQSPRRRRWCTQGVRLGEDDIVDIIRLSVVVLLNYVFPHWTIFLSPAVVEVKCSPQSVLGVFQPKITKETFHLTQNCECAMPILGTQFNWRTKKSGRPGVQEKIENVHTAQSQKLGYVLPVAWNNRRLSDTCWTRGAVSSNETRGGGAH